VSSIDDVQRPVERGEQSQGALFALEPSLSPHRIVVGVEGSVGSTRALDWAIAQAQRTGAVLDVVTAWMFPMAIGYAFTTTVDEVRRRAQEVIDRAITHVAQVAPDVVVHGEAIEQSPAPALVNASKGADLLVVGSRGMGGFTELMVGSVGQYCTRRASCSVVVVR
jgi:nucleotide-binding universal stress UspA family protein